MVAEALGTVELASVAMAAEAKEASEAVADLDLVVVETAVATPAVAGRAAVR